MKSVLLRFSGAVLLVCVMILVGCGEKQSSGVQSEASSGLSQSDIEKFNYAMGTSFGAMLKTQGLAFDAKSFAQGVSEQISGKGKLTPEQASELIDSIFTRKQAIEAERNAIAGARFLDSIGRLEGVVRDSSGLLYRVLEPGTGVTPNENSTVEVFYVGKLIDGTEFDANRTEEPTSLNLQGVIKGWTYGLQKVKEGGKIELYIPAQLGYGERGAGPIPGNSTLCFEVQLVKVQPANSDDAGSVTK